MKSKAGPQRNSPIYVVLVLLAVMGMFALGGCPDPTGGGDNPGGQDNPSVPNDPGDGQDPGTPGDDGQDPTEPDGDDGDSADPGDGGTDPGEGNGSGDDPGDGGSDPGDDDPGDGDGSEPTDSALTGTWTGDVDYSASTLLKNSPEQDWQYLGTTDTTRAQNVTFDETGRPDSAVVILTQAPLVIVEIPMSGLSQPGDQVEVQVTGNGAGPVTAVLQEMALTETTSEARLGISYAPDGTGFTFEGSHVLTASRQQDGSILYQAETNLETGSDAGIIIGSAATGSGTLAR